MKQEGEIFGYENKSLKTRVCNFLRHKNILYDKLCGRMLR